MSKRRSAVVKIADHLGVDAAELRGYRYQPTRFSSAVYALDDEYWAAGTNCPKGNNMDTEWNKVVDAYGDIMWVHKVQR